MTRVGLGLALLTAGAFELEGCGSSFPSAELHYKLAVDVDVDGVTHHGEGVYRVDFQSQGPLLIGNTPQWSVAVTGEAFPIDLGKRGIIFVLMYPDSFRAHVQDPLGNRSVALSTAGAGRQALWSYFGFAVNDFPNGREAQAKIEAFAKSQATQDMPPTALPLVVRFRDIDDPKSIERVDPLVLAASLGPGVTIPRVTASITQEKITTGIDHYPKWLPGLRGSIGWSMQLPYTDLLNVCDDGAFRQGNPK